MVFFFTKKKVFHLSLGWSQLVSIGSYFIITNETDVGTNQTSLLAPFEDIGVLNDTYKKINQNLE